MMNAVFLYFIITSQGDPGMSHSQNVEKVFNQLNASTMNILDEFYDKDVVFIDPLGEHQGLESVRSYYENLYKNVQEIRFDFSRHVESQDSLSSEWTMLLRASGLNGGDEVVVDGISVFKFDPLTRKVIYHRDYFDMGEFIYENVPVLGSVIRFIKSKMKS